MTVSGADYGGFCLEETVVACLEKNSIPYHDYGCYSKEPVDYALFVSKVAYDMAGGRAEKGILCCGTGAGVSVAASKVKRIRTAVCTDEFCAEATRRHNDASILCMGSRVIDGEMAAKLTKVFLKTPFDGERHARRTAQIKEIKDREKL